MTDRKDLLLEIIKENNEKLDSISEIALAAKAMHGLLCGIEQPNHKNEREYYDWINGIAEVSYDVGKALADLSKKALRDESLGMIKSLEKEKPLCQKSLSQQV